MCVGSKEDIRLLMFKIEGIIICVWIGVFDDMLR